MEKRGLQTERSLYKQEIPRDLVVKYNPSALKQKIERKNTPPAHKKYRDTHEFFMSKKEDS